MLLKIAATAQDIEAARATNTACNSPALTSSSQPTVESRVLKILESSSPLIKIV